MDMVDLTALTIARIVLNSCVPTVCPGCGRRYLTSSPPRKDDPLSATVCPACDTKAYASYMALVPMAPLPDMPTERIDTCENLHE
jgi:hypothetical protein